MSMSPWVLSTYTCVCVQSWRNNNERYLYMYIYIYIYIQTSHEKWQVLSVWSFFFFKVISAPPKNTVISALQTACHLILLDACCAVTPQSSAGALALARTADIVVVQHSHCGWAGKGSVFLAEVYHRWGWRNIQQGQVVELGRCGFYSFPLFRELYLFSLTKNPWISWAASARLIEYTVVFLWVIWVCLGMLPINNSIF